MRQRQVDKTPSVDEPKLQRSKKVLIACVSAFATAIAGLGALATWNWTATKYHDATDRSDVRVLMSMERYQTVQGETWVLPGELSPTADETKMLSNPFNPGSDVKDALGRFRSWAREKGGADPGVSFVKLIVQGGRHETVRMVGMRAVIKKRSDPLSGTLMWGPAQGGENVTQLGLNLDEAAPAARVVEHGEFGTAHFGAPYFDTKQTKTLTNGEQEVFLVEARTTNHYVEWCIELELLVGMHQRLTQTCPKGQNLRTSAIRFSTSPNLAYPGKFQEYRKLYSWDFQKNGFYPADPKIFTWQ
jgi:hypothetical protein